MRQTLSSVVKFVGLMLAVVFFGPGVQLQPNEQQE